MKAKQKAEDCWQATQKLHRLEVSVEEADKRIDFCTRRIIVGSGEAHRGRDANADGEHELPTGEQERDGEQVRRNASQGERGEAEAKGGRGRGEASHLGSGRERDGAQDVLAESA